MRYVCAWCGKDLEGYPPSDSEEVSHGICEECFKEQLKEITDSKEAYLGQRAC